MMTTDLRSSSSQTLAAMRMMNDDRQTVDKGFKQSVIGHITGLRNDVNQVRASVENIRLTLETHGRLLRCVADQNLSLPSSSQEYTIADRTISCRDAASSLMSQREILLDFIDRRARYREGGDCGLAAAEAWEFFDRSHKLMRPKLMDGVRYAASGEKAVMGKSGTVPAQLVGISPTMKPYKLLECSDKGCIWVPLAEEALHTVMNDVGMAHRVTMVTPLEGGRVVVDWGIGQFSYLPADIRLFIKPE